MSSLICVGVVQCCPELTIIRPGETKVSTPFKIFFTHLFIFLSSILSGVLIRNLKKMNSNLETSNRTDQNQQSYIFVDGCMELIDFNFLEESPFDSILNTRCIVKKLIIKQTGERVPTTDKDTEFYAGMLKVINFFFGVVHLVIENYPTLTCIDLSGLNLSMLNKMKSLKIRKCRLIGFQFFGWVADNCKALISFELSCRYFIHPIYQVSNDANTEVYYGLHREDLIKFFTNNRKSLVKVFLQIDQLLWNEQLGGETVYDSICKCTKLESISLFVESEKPFSLYLALKLFQLPCLIQFDHFIKFRNIIHFQKLNENGEESSDLVLFGSKELRSDPFTSRMLISLFENLKNRLMRIFFTHVDGVNPDVIKCIAENNDENHIKIVKFVDCGFDFKMEDLDGMIRKCPGLKVMILFECCASIGKSNMHIMENGTFFAVVNSGKKLLHCDLRHFKKQLGELEYFWLEEEGTQDQVDSEYESSEDESVDESVDY